MDEKLAHGIARSYIRDAWNQRDASRDEAARIIRPFVERLSRRGKLSRAECHSLAVMYNKFSGNAWHQLHACSFERPGVSRLSHSFVFFTIEVGLAPARLNIKDDEFEPLYELHIVLRAIRERRITIRQAVTPIQFKFHSIARFIERADSKISDITSNFAPSLLLLLLLREQLGLNSPIAVPHEQGLFLGLIEKHINLDETVKCFCLDLTSHEYSEKTVKYAFGLTHKARPMITTFLSNMQLGDDQEQFRCRFNQIALRYHEEIFWRAAREFLVLDKNELDEWPIEAKKELPKDFLDSLNYLVNDPLWEKSLKLPKFYNGEQVI